MSAESELTLKRNNQGALGTSKGNEAVARVGIVGCGNMAEVHAQAFEKNGARVVAVCDVNPGAGEEMAEKHKSQSYTDYCKMLGNESLDAVSICTPPAYHEQPAMAALGRGLPVLCEKPLASSSDAARRMVQAAKAANAILATGFCHRFHPPVVRLRELIESGELGTPVLIRNRFAGRFAGVEKKWFSQRAVSGGGVLMDTSSHSIDLFRYLAGEVRVAKAYGSTHLPELSVEDSACMVLLSSDGVLGVIEASWVTPITENLIEVTGTRGRAIVDYGNWGAGEVRYRTEGTSDWEVIELNDSEDRFSLQAQHFLDCIRTGTVPRATGEDGLRTLEVIEAAFSMPAA